jgi:hypothetical protein
VDSSRHGLFRYLTADETAGYLAIMDMFSATLLTDLSAVEVTTQLAERSVSLDRNIVEAPSSSRQSEPGQAPVALSDGTER